MRRSLWLLVSVLVLASGVAQAADDPKAKARQLGEDGAVALEAKDFKKALELFTEANGLFHAPTLVLGLARAQAGNGKLLAALATYQGLIKEGPGKNPPPAFKKAIDDAKKEAPAIEARLAHLVVAVTPANAVVKLNGEAFPAEGFGHDRAVDPGRYEATASADGHVTKKEAIELAEGAKGTLQITLARMGTELPVAPVPQKKPFPLRTVGFVALGVGGASLVVAGVTGAMAIGKKGELDKACAKVGCPKSAEGTLGDYHTLGGVSTATFVLGVVAAGAGATLVVMTRPKAKTGSISKSFAFESVEARFGVSDVSLSGRF